jgi:nucleoside transporter
MPGGLRPRLAALMFLTYAVYGVWAVTLGAFLMGSPHEGGLNMPAGHVALIYATLAVGATVSPLLAGLLADRLFATQRVLAVLHLVGAGLLAAMLWVCVSSTGQVRQEFDRIARSDSMQVPITINEGSETWTTTVEGTLEDVLTDIREIRRYRRTVSPVGRLLTGYLPFDWCESLGYSLVIYPKEVPASAAYAHNSDEIIDALESHAAKGIRQVREHPAVRAAADRAFPPLFALMLAYACVYLPTIGLSNALTFRNLPDPRRQYGPFRAIGTFGWIAAGLFVGFAAPAVSPLPFLYAAIGSAVLAGLCLLLPHTPPVPRGAHATPLAVADALGLPALRMLADRSFLVYVLAALAATFLMPFHNSFTNKFLVDLGVPHPAATQTLAQPTEILGTLLIPWVWARLGTKWMLCVGLVASAARFAMYATESVPAVVGLGLPLHGVGFSLFYIAAALYVDRQAPPDLRASAQGLVTVVTLGLGGVLGNWFAGRVVAYHTAGGAVDWRPVWLVPAVGTLMAAGGLALFFREGRLVSPHPPGPPLPQGERGEQNQDASGSPPKMGESDGIVSSSPSPFMGEGAGG